MIVSVGAMILISFIEPSISDIFLPDEIAHVDETMQEIRIEMDNIKEDTTGPQALYEKLKKIDINLI